MLEQIKQPWRKETIQRGVHAKREDGVCAMEMVAWMAGEAHSDRPTCASGVVGEFIRRWNDSLLSDQDREILRPILPLVIDSRTVGEQLGGPRERSRVALCQNWILCEQVRSWLNLVPSLKLLATAIPQWCSVDPAAKLQRIAEVAVRHASSAPWRSTSSFISAQDAVKTSGAFAALGTIRPWSEDKIAIVDWSEKIIRASARSAVREAKGDAVLADTLFAEIQRLQRSAIHLIKDMATIERK